MTTLDEIFARLLAASVQASFMAAVVSLVTLLAGRWISPRWRCVLWSLVFLRLLLPALPPSPWNFAPQPPAVVSAVLPRAEVETVTYGVIPDGGIEAQVSASTPHVNWLPLAWLTVATLLIVRRATGYAWLVRKLNRLPTLRVDGMSAVETSLVSSPGVVGIIRPRLLLPPGLIDRLSPAELRFIVGHERAHVRRGDLIAGAATTFITAIHWFNPLVRLAAARFRAERELACDQAVLRSTPDGRAYGDTILRLIDLATNRRQPAGVAGVVSTGRRTLRRRIASIANPPARWSPLGPLVVIAIALTMLTEPRRANEVNAAAAPATAPNVEDDRNTLTRIYDVRDLLIDIPDFAPPDFEPREVPTTARAVATETPTSKPTTQAYRDAIERLKADITGTIDPRSWRDNGGTVGSVRDLQGQLIVTQTRRNQERILQKLQTMRGARGVQVTLEARILTGVDAEAALDEPGHWRPLEPGANPRTDAMWSRFLTDADVTRLFNARQADPKATIVTAPRITLFNGQRAYVLVSRQSAYVADLRKNVPGAKDEFEPVVKSIDTGVMLDARASVVTDDDGIGKFVTLMLNPRLSTLIEFEPQRWPGAPAGRDDLMIQVPHTLVSRLQRTVTIPDGQTVMYRVFPVRHPAQRSATQPAEPPREPAIMLFKPTVIDAAGAEPKEYPLLSTSLKRGEQPAASRPLDSPP